MSDNDTIDLERLSRPTSSQTDLISLLNGGSPDQRLSETMTHRAGTGQASPGLLATMADAWRNSPGPFPAPTPYQPGMNIAEYVRAGAPGIAEAAGGFAGPVKMSGGGSRFGKLSERGMERLREMSVNRNVPAKPKTFEEWQRYHDDFVKTTPPENVPFDQKIWNDAKLISQVTGESLPESFARMVNIIWQQQGANRWMTPGMARRHIAVQEASSKGIRAVPDQVPE